MVFGFVFLVVFMAGVQHLCTSSTRSLPREDLQVGGKANNGLLTRKVKRLLCEGIKEYLERWISRSGINSCNLLWVLLHAGTWWSCASKGELGSGLQEHLSHSHQWCSPLMDSVWLGRWLVWWHCHMRSVSCLPVVPPPVNWHPDPNEPLQLLSEKKWVSTGRNVHTQPRTFSPRPEYFLLSPKSKAEACAGY